MYLLYFDPGLGAMIVQGIVAVVAGVVMFSKNLLYKIKLFLGMTKNEHDNLFDDIDIKNSDVGNETQRESEKSA